VSLSDICGSMILLEVIWRYNNTEERESDFTLKDKNTSIVVTVQHCVI